MVDEAEAEISSITAYWRGMCAAATGSVFTLVIFGTFVGYGALSHDLGFSLVWALTSTVLVWAGPAQLIVVTTLASGVSFVQAAVAVSLSGMRLLPMVAALLPSIRTPATPFWQLLLPAHFTAASTWVEGLRLSPAMPRERRIAFYNGLGTVLMLSALIATTTGFALAARLPPVLAAAVLFLTPMSFLVSIYSNGRMLIDRLALGLGLVFTPLFALAKFDLALLIGGVAAGTLAYVVHRLRGGR
ncbi:MAG: AzlC family ABC transporter permease [Xanthobacteraceae bacterium]